MRKHNHPSFRRSRRNQPLGKYPGDVLTHHHQRNPGDPVVGEDMPSFIRSMAWFAAGYWIVGKLMGKKGSMWKWNT